MVVETAAEDQIDFGEADEATSVGTSQSNGDFVHVEHEEIDFGDVDDNISWNISVQDDGSGNVDSIGACFLLAALVDSDVSK